MSTLKQSMEKLPAWAKYTLYTILGLAGAFLFGLLFGKIIVWLWNWLMPSLFGIRTITFWEGFGILVLAKILFGFGGSSHGKDGDSKKRRKSKQPQDGDPERGDWAYYDDWWEADGKTAFRDYTERMKHEATRAGEPEEPKEA